MSEKRRLETLYSTANALFDLGGMDKKTMRDIETFCLPQIQKLSHDEIAALREREGVSQAVFAAHLNIKPKLVSDWERGVRNPSGPSLKLLSLVKEKGLAAVI